MPRNKHLESPPARPDFPNKDPWASCRYDIADASAVQALMRGDANADQQMRALDFILDVICNRNDMSYRPGGLDGDRATAFAEGKRYVAHQIVKLGLTPLSKLKKD